MGRVKKDIQAKENDLSYHDTYLREMSGRKILSEV